MTCVSGAIVNSPPPLIVSVALPLAFVVIESPANTCDAGEAATPLICTPPIIASEASGGCTLSSRGGRAHAEEAMQNVSSVMRTNRIRRRNSVTLAERPSSPGRRRLDLRTTHTLPAGASAVSSTAGKIWREGCHYEKEPHIGWIPEKCIGDLLVRGETRPQFSFLD
jgi:hypothetical protein